MDLREYDYICRRPDTFQVSVLDVIYKVLTHMGARNKHLIEKVLREGYVQPPPGYKWHGCYRNILTTDESKAVLADLLRAEEAMQAHPWGERDMPQRLKHGINYWSSCIGQVPETYEEYKAKQAFYDLRNISQEAFCNLIFDHPVVDKTKKAKEWYWGIDNWVEWDKVYVVQRYIGMFSESDKLLTRYPKDQLEQGCWFMMSLSLDFSAHQLINDDELDIALKERLINSMYSLYEKFFFDEPLETSSYMWWDSFASDYDVPGKRGPTHYEEDKRIQDAMFSTLVKIILLESEICQDAAIHGLGHLGHPDTEKVIKDYMKKHPDLTEKEIDYLNNCITGDIM